MALCLQAAHHSPLCWVLFTPHRRWAKCLLLHGYRQLPAVCSCRSVSSASLAADLTAAEAHHLLMLLHEWDLSGTARHSLTDVYVCLQLLALVRVASGVLSGQGQGHGQLPPSGLQPHPDRPDSRQSTATASSLTTNSTTVPNKAAAGAGDGPAGFSRQANRQQGKHSKRGAIGAAWEGLGSGSGAAGSGPGGVGGGSSGSRGGVTLKEVYLKERVATLEAELSHARAGAGGVSSKEVRLTCTASECVIRWELCVLHVLPQEDCSWQG